MARPIARRTGPSWLRWAGWAGVASGVFGVLGIAADFAFSGDGTGPEHELHWVSHLVGTPAGIATIGAVAGVLGLERRTLGRAGLVAGAALVLASAVGAAGGALVGWAGGVQGISEGGLWVTGHRIGDLGVVGLPATLALGAVVALRAQVLPRWSGWLPLLAVPPAIVGGIALGALGHDAGTAAVLVMAAPAGQLAVWGHRMLACSAPDARRPTRPVADPISAP